MATKLQLCSSCNDYRQNIVQTISFFPVKSIAEDKTVSTALIPTDFFLDSDKWHISFFAKFEQFTDSVGKYLKNHRRIRNLTFGLNNENMNNELKYIVHSKIFSEEWALEPTYGYQTSSIKRYSLFINEFHPNINSLLELDANQVHSEWLEWLNSCSVPIMRPKRPYCAYKESSLDYTHAAGFLRSIYKYLSGLTDTRDELEKDIWDVKKMQHYGIEYSRSITAGYMNFSKIHNRSFRTQCKKVVRDKLLVRNNCSWRTAVNTTSYISRFLNCISEMEPEWKTLKKLKRHHIEKYIEYLNQYAAALPRADANPKKYVYRSISIISRFLSEAQVYGYDLAPEKNILSLIFPDDRPTVPKKPYDQIDYIPDFVLKQLFEKIEFFHQEAVPVLWTMYKTGLRISDTLELRHGCLLKINGEFWIECDISKTYVQGHRIPIDDELASLLAVLIDESVRRSNMENNPKKFIFVRYKGKNKGNPYNQGWFREQLNRLAHKHNIIDELGNPYHFKNHAFRHTYAIKMMNSGVDIVTIQELLAHASPEMTLRYAKLLDNTKRKAFDKAVSQGVFSFQDDTLLPEPDEEISPQLLDMLWTNHKLHAVDTPYGTCLQRSKGNCQYAKRPPCLSCNAGFPCKDLCIGALDSDPQKYELLIQSTQSLICNAKCHDRNDIATSNEELLVLYRAIHSKISQGSIIFSRMDRLKSALL